MRPPLKMRMSSRFTLSAVKSSSASTCTVSTPPSSSIAAQPGMTAPAAAALFCSRRVARPATSVEESGAPMQSMAVMAAAMPLSPPPNSRNARPLSTAAPSRMYDVLRARRSLARSPKLCSSRASSHWTGRLSRTQGSFSSRLRASIRIRSLSLTRNAPCSPAGSLVARS